MPFSDEKNGQPTGQKYADLNKLSLTKGAKITNIFCQYKQTVPSHFLSTTKELQALKKNPPLVQVVSVKSLKDIFS